MKPFIDLMNIINHLKTNYPDIDTRKLRGGEKEKQAVLATIKKFSNYDYIPEHKFFSTQIGDFMFATENVELKDINSSSDLYKAIEYLNDATRKRQKSVEQTTNLPDRLFEKPEHILDISSKNIKEFLEETYEIKEGKDYSQLDKEKQKEIIYDMYRVFTGYIPLKGATGGIYFTHPDNPEIKFRQHNYPNFSNENLGMHIWDMVEIKNHNTQMLNETTQERIEQMKKMSEEQNRKRDRKQEQDEEQEL